MCLSEERLLIIRKMTREENTRQRTIVPPTAKPTVLRAIIPLSPMEGVGSSGETSGARRVKSKEMIGCTEKGKKRVRKKKKKEN